MLATPLNVDPHPFERPEVAIHTAYLNEIADIPALADYKRCV